MEIPDGINGAFEILGSILIWINVLVIYKAKGYKGVSIVPMAFFTLWGMWNLYYYPHLGQWLSFYGGVSIVIANGAYVWLMYKYRKGA